MGSLRLFNRFHYSIYDQVSLIVSFYFGLALQTRSYHADHTILRSCCTYRG